MHLGEIQVTRLLVQWSKHAHTLTHSTQNHTHVNGGNASVVVITSCTHKFVLEMPQPIQVKRYHISVTQVPLYTSCVEHRETSEFLRHANIESVSTLTLGTKNKEPPEPPKAEVVTRTDNSVTGLYQCFHLPNSSIFCTKN